MTAFFQTQSSLSSGNSDFMIFLQIGQEFVSLHPSPEGTTTQKASNSRLAMTICITLPFSIRYSVLCPIVSETNKRGWKNVTDFKPTGTLIRHTVLPKMHVQEVLHSYSHQQVGDRMGNWIISELYQDDSETYRYNFKVSDMYSS